jgi:hypothetical protein
MTQKKEATESAMLPAAAAVYEASRKHYSNLAQSIEAATARAREALAVGDHEAANRELQEVHRLGPEYQAALRKFLAANAALQRSLKLLERSEASEKKPH